MSSNVGGQQPSNIISGKVAVADRAVGIPDLLVVIYDLDPATKPEEFIASAAAIDGGFDINALGDRIGSVLTSPDGLFSLGYEDNEFRVRNPDEKRPDLLLLVLAPEQPGKSTQELLLYSASDVRQNAGRIESYYIELDPALLKKAGVPIPEGAPAASDEVDASIASLGGVP
jgi:hypothetical protein